MKNRDELLTMPVFSRYRDYKFKHTFLWIESKKRYAFVCEAGILFEDLEFIDSEDLELNTMEDLLYHIEESLGGYYEIEESNPWSKNPQYLGKSDKEILDSNPFFKKHWHEVSSKNLRLKFSEKLQKYYLRVLKGVIFEDGVFYTNQEVEELKNQSVEMLKTIHAAKHVFGWDQVQLYEQI
jgi:hypothetical protein